MCCAHALVNGKCDIEFRKPPITLCPNCCAPGYEAQNGSCCLASRVTSTGLCCQAGEIRSKDGTTCQPLRRIPNLTVCCAGGFIPGGDGKCCAAANLTNDGQCCPTPVDPNDRSRCLQKSESKTESPTPCGPGKIRDKAGKCIDAGRTIPGPSVKPTPPVRRKCAPGERQDAAGECVKIELPKLTKPKPLVCPPGTIPGPLGKRCIKVPTRNFEPPKLRRAPPLLCPRGTVPDARGTRCIRKPQ